MKLGRFRSLLAVGAAATLAIIPVIGVDAAKGNAPNLSLLPVSHLQKMTKAEMNKLGLVPSTEKVIVLMKSQYLGMDTSSHRDLVARSAQIAAAERSVVSQLTAVHATHVRAYSLINAVAATVSPAEATYLRSQQGVKAVVQDKRLYLPKPVTADVDPGIVGKSPAQAAARKAVRKAAATSCDANKPLLEPEALTQINAQFQNPSANGQAASLATGKGVNVAFMADGVDLNNPDFIRPNGQSVFTDAQDFGGSGGFYAGGNTEGMLDASSIGAQGNERYFIGQYTNYMDSAFNFTSACPVIKVVGDAPGANLIDLQVFGTYATTGGFIQAIQYAVNHGVNVLNQSFGSNPYPDQDTDPISLADKAAVAAGVTIVASSGDAGTNGTQGAPSTLPGVIAAGASTSFQIYQQLGEEGFATSNGKYIDNGVSALSSAGPNQAGTKGPSVLAPGDLNWVLCDPGASCHDDNGNNVGVWESGGTSESAPLTSGVAALVIQKYRETHHGSSPTPQVVADIITSTATNLNLPSNIQGSGLLNAYKAVELAASWGKSSAKGHVGDTLGIDVNNCTASSVCNTTLSAAGNPGTSEHWTVKVTNNGKTPQKVSAAIKSLQTTGTNTGTVTMTPGTDPYFIDPSGFQRSYQKTTTNVAAGTTNVNFAVGWDIDSDPGSLVRLAVLNPAGDFACYSLPQGSGNGYGNCMVSNPKPGTWTLVVFTRGVAGVGYTGTVNWSATSSSYHSAGTVTPSSKMLDVGKSQDFTVHSTLPATAGDAAASVVFSSKDNNSVVPVIERSLIPTTASGGNFTGTFNGGNGRSSGANEQTYQFNVPASQNDVSVGLALADSTTEDSVEAVLTNPAGVPIDVQSNVTAINPSTGVPTAVSQDLQLFRMNPEAGVWTLTLMTNFYSGPTTSEGFTGAIAFDAVNVQSSGVPNSASTTISPSSPVNATITVTNTGNATENYYVDPRLNSTSGYLLLPPNDDNGGAPTMSGEFLLPTLATDLDFIPSGSDSSPLNVEGVYDAGQFPVGILSNPDGFLASNSNSPDLEYSTSEIPSGEWSEYADDIDCPCTSSLPDASDDITVQAAALMNDFDDSGVGGSVTSSTGDLWTNSLGAPLTLNPGQSGQITIQISPTASTGTEVQGNLYIDTVGLEAPGYFNSGGATDEVAAVPYDYTVGS